MTLRRSPIASSSKVNPGKRVLPYWVVARIRLATSALVGVVAGFLMPGRYDAAVRILVGWDVGALALLAMTVTMMLRSNSDHMRRRAAQQDQGRWVILGIMVLGAGASLVAPILTERHLQQTGETTLYVALAAATMLVTWLVLHTVFALHYAHNYYGLATDENDADGLIGGLEFPGEKQPDYLDFMYFSFVVGMTCQVSDVQVSGRMLRRMTLFHGVVAFFYNTIIVALTINILAGQAGH